MNTRFTIFAGSLMLAAGATSLQAADIYAPTHGGMKDLAAGEETFIPEAVTFQESADWFIRGDVGFSHYSGYSSEGTSGATNYSMNGYNLNPTFAGSIGFGRYVTPQFRLGLDIDYRHATDETFGNAGIASTSPIYNVGDIPVAVNSTAFMLTAIYDFTPDRAMSPYVGGGIGWAINEVNMKGSHFANDFDGDGDTDYGSINNSGETSNAFAAELMAGVSFHLRQNLFMDVGYKFTYLGSAGSDYRYSVRSSDSGLASTGTGEFNFDDLMTHDFRVGLRYDLY